MGWSHYNRYSKKSDKKAFIEDILESGNLIDPKTKEVIGKHSTLQKSVRGNRVWSIQEHIRFATKEKAEERNLSIRLDLLSFSDNSWGYKDICESMGPSYYNCPVSFFKKVPEIEGTYSPEWRKKVLKYHALQKDIKEIECGDVLEATNGKSYFVVSVGRQIVGKVDGQVFGIPKRMILSVQKKSEEVPA